MKQPSRAGSARLRLLAQMLRRRQHGDADPALPSRAGRCQWPPGAWHPACTRAGWLLMLLRDSRHAAVVALLVLLTGHWVPCPCSPSATATAKTGHAPTTVQDPHACCDTQAGLRAGSRCCPESALEGESAVIAPSSDTGSILTPAPLTVPLVQAVAREVTPLRARGTAALRPPLSSVLRI
jgi:hypothetical protein